MLDATRTERGTTLLEAIVAAGLLACVVAGTASLILLARRLGAQAEASMTATTLAMARLQALRAIPWGYDLAGAAVDVPALAPGPPDALDRNVSGYWDELDGSGRPVAASGAGSVFVRRWAIWPVASSGGGHARALEVCVFGWPAGDRATPLACVASVRTRQP